MKRLPQTNFDEKLSLVYENMHTGKQEVVKEWAPIVGALARGAVAGLASGAVSNMMDDDEDSENAEDVRGESGGFSIRNELLNLYSNLDQEARTQSGASVSEELKMIIDELDDIVNKAEWDKV